MRLPLIHRTILDEPSLSINIEYSTHRIQRHEMRLQKLSCASVNNNKIILAVKISYKMALPHNFLD